MVARAARHCSADTPCAAFCTGVDATTGAATDAYDSGVPLEDGVPAPVGVAAALAAVVGVALAEPENVPLTALAGAAADETNVADTVRCCGRSCEGCEGCGGCGCGDCGDAIWSEAVRRIHGDDDHGDDDAAADADRVVEPATAVDVDADSGSDSSSKDMDADSGNATGAPEAGAPRRITTDAELMAPVSPPVPAPVSVGSDATGSDSDRVRGSGTGGGIGRSWNTEAASERMASRETPR